MDINRSTTCHHKTFPFLKFPYIFLVFHIYEPISPCEPDVSGLGLLAPVLVSSQCHSLLPALVTASPVSLDATYNLWGGIDHFMLEWFYACVVLMPLFLCSLTCFSCYVVLLPVCCLVALISMLSYWFYFSCCFVGFFILLCCFNAFMLSSCLNFYDVVLVIFFMLFCWLFILLCCFNASHFIPIKWFYFHIVLLSFLLCCLAIFILIVPYCSFYVILLYCFYFYVVLLALFLCWIIFSILILSDLLYFYIVCLFLF